ncbi:regulator of G-protein signaling [Acrasis kona]|uniref:Regulator of G-protein signaling n=1 Tax=Acrasis kona TaxID=1008807 RepID=A0AAW2ZK86_9EUKA
MEVSSTLTAAEIVSFSIGLPIRLLTSALSLGFGCIIATMMYKSPLRSRHFVPFSFLFFKFVFSIIAIAGVIPEAWSPFKGQIVAPAKRYVPVVAQISCFSMVYGRFPFAIVHVLAVGLLNFRYLMMRMTNISKQRAIVANRNRYAANKDQKIETNSLAEDSVVILRLVQSFTSRTLLLGGMCAYVILYYMVAIIDSNLHQNECREGFNSVVYMFALISKPFLALVIFATLGFDLLYDLITTEQKNRSLRKIFLDDDTQRIRLEAFFMSIAVLGYMVADIIASSLPSNVVPYKELIYCLTSFFLWEIPSLIAMPGVVFVATVIQNKNFKTGNGGPVVPEPCAESVLFVLSEPFLHEMLKNFAVKEFSVENVIAYDDIMLFKSEIEVDRRMELCSFIFETYLKNNAISPINVSMVHVSEAWKRVEEHFKVAEEFPLPEDLFDKIRSVIVVNLVDTYARFKKYPPYIEYMKNNPNQLASVQKRQVLKL